MSLQGPILGNRKIRGEIVPSLTKYQAVLDGGQYKATAIHWILDDGHLAL